MFSFTRRSIFIIKFIVMLSHIGKALCLSLVLVVTCSAYDVKIASSFVGRGGRIAGGKLFLNNEILKEWNT